MFMDINQEIKSFTPIDIERFSQENQVSEKIIDSVKAYNKAIEYLKTGSEDIAMIELKRVIAVNPDFYEAVNLLGLCYAYTNQLDKAQELFGKVVQGENTVLKAADYLNFVTSGESGLLKKSSRLVKSNERQKKPATARKETGKKEEHSGGAEVREEYILLKKLGDQLKKPSVALAFNLFGVVCLIAAVIFFAMAARGSGKAPIDNEPAGNTVANVDYDRVLAENQELQKQLDAANLQLKQHKLSADLSQVSSLSSQKKYIEASDKLSTIPVEELNTDLKKRYDSLKKDVDLRAATLLTTQGNTLYNSKKYQEAIEKLEKVFKLGDKWSFGDKALYILGKSYVQQGDKQKGAEAYEKLINQYPKSSYVKSAKSRLSSIK